MGGKGCPLCVVGCLRSSWKVMVSSILHNLSIKDGSGSSFETIAKWHKQYGSVGAIAYWIERKGLSYQKDLP